MATAEAKLETVSATRNSQLRDRIKEPIIAITKIFHKHCPGVSPTFLTVLGALEVGTGAIIAATRDPEKIDGEIGKTAAAGILIAKGSGLDAFDGTLARIKDAEIPGSVNFKGGQLYDALSDRVQEKALAISRGVTAGKRGGLVGLIGEIAAFATDITSSWPSVSRSLAESKGKAVPESGKGILGFVGTRAGRAVIGGLATLYPEPKGLPLQTVSDTWLTLSNIITTIDRLHTAFSSKDASLSEDVRKDAKDRLKVLTAFTAISTGISLFSYIKRHRHQEQAEKPSQSVDLIRVISAVEKYCREQELDHRFVGGAVTDFIGPQTWLVTDISEKTAVLFNTNKPGLVRGDKTIRDIDLVVFTPDRDKFLRARQDFTQWHAEANAKGIKLPRISVEAAKHPHWPKRSHLKQFVSAFEVDKSGVPHLAFGAIERALKPESIAPWTVIIEDGTKVVARISTFNPVAHALCYHLRVPSGVKKKDKEIIGSYDFGAFIKNFSRLSLVENFALQTIREGLSEGVDYANLFTGWYAYIEDLAKRPDIHTRLKKIITGLYWDTIGTQVAHGKGVFSKLTMYSDKLPG